MHYSTHTLLPQKQPLVLAADDNRTQRALLAGMVEALGYGVLEASNGKEALDLMAAHAGDIDTIILHREMPVMDGMVLTMRMKENAALRSIPIVMQTDSNRPEHIKQGIDAGVFYYLTKPVNQDVLKSVLLAAIRETYRQRLLASELNKHKTCFHLIDTCQFRLRTLAEAEHLATFLANCFPDAQRTVSGLAELLVNAVEHGNLGINYQEKTQLIEHGSWRNEIERRQLLPENANKHVDVLFQKTSGSSAVTITDCGDGFEWKNYLHIDPARASHNHGRGIAQANALSFDTIVFNERGNAVSAYVHHEKPLEW